MKNTEILGLTNPLPVRVEAQPTPEQKADELQQLIDERAQFEKEEHLRLARGGADYSGRETIRAFFTRFGR